MDMTKEKVDWAEPALNRWLGEISKKSTRNVYQSAYRLYAEFTGLSAGTLIEEASADSRREGLNKEGIVLKRLLSFNDWLLHEVPRKRSVGKGLSPKISYTYTQAIRSFYGTFDIYVKLTRKSALPKPRVLNKRLELDQRDMKKLLDHTKSPRDRAMLLTMFQGGLDVSTLCALTYGDVAKGLELDEHPLKLDLVRGKSGAVFFTFIGQDATEAIKAYLNDVRAAGVEFNIGAPLFLKANYKNIEGIQRNNVEDMMRELAIRAGFVDNMKNGYAQNPLGPHALRESFSKILTNRVKIPNSVVDFWLGHSLGQLSEAYLHSSKIEDLRKLYVEAEPFLSVTGVGESEKMRAELTKKLEGVQRGSESLQELVNRLSADALMHREREESLSRRVIGLEKKVEEQSKVIEIIIKALKQDK